MKKAGDIAAGQTADLLEGITDAKMKKTLSRLQETLNDPRHKAKQQEQELIDRKQAEVKGQLVQLPLWPEPVRGVPNATLRGALFAAIQGKDRKYLKRDVLAVQDGVTVRFTGMQLDQSDLDVWEQCLHLAHYHPLGTRCDFTAHAFLKALGRKTGKSQHEQLKDNFARLNGCSVEITHNGMTYFGSLIDGGIRDEVSGLYCIQINPTLCKLYAAGWTATDWEQRRQLRGKPLALWLHGFYSTHAKPLPHKVETLHKLCGSGNPDLAGFKTKLKKAHDELKAIGAINGYRIEGDLVRANRTPSKSQRKHLRKAKPRKK